MDYVCPRCDYKTNRRNDMKRHFSRQKVCPDKNNLILTDTIIEIVLNNRFYHRSQPDDKPTIVNNNNNNTVYNMITNMGSLEKMSMFLDYNGQSMIDVSDRLEIEFDNKIKRLEDSSYRTGYFLSQDALFDLVNKSTLIESSDKLNELNVLFEKSLKQFHMYRDGSWETYLEEIGLKEFIGFLRRYFLDKYELYLIKNLHSTSGRLSLRELNRYLDIYYRFLIALDMPPIITEYNDREILGYNAMENNPRYISNKYTDDYYAKKKEVKMSEMNSIRRRVLEIIKINTIHNLSKLNGSIDNLINSDEKFREFVCNKKLVK